MSESELEDSEGWKRATELARVGIWQIDKSFNITYVNSCMAEMLGYSAEEIMGNNLLSFVSEDSKNVLTQCVEERGRGVGEGYEFGFLRKDGSGIFTLIAFDRIFDADGKFERGTLTAIDITKQRVTEDILKASQNAIKTIFDALSDSLSTIDSGSRISKLMNRIKELLDNNASICGVQEKEQIEDELRVHTQHLKELVEERIQELLKAERMAAIGQAAAMIAHDLRSPLQDIRLAQHFLGKLHPHERKLLSQVDRGIEYAEGVVDSLLIYSQDRRLNHQDTNMNSMLSECLRESPPPEHIKVEEKLSEVPRICVDQNQMKRVFKNLILNAIQSMANGGTLTLETKCVGDTAVISVIDIGEGISEIKQDLIWKPFYTSKPRGMGLGLSVAKHVVELHGGTIDVKSKLGEGSTFTVRIPMHKPGITTFSPLERQNVVSAK